MAGLDGSFAARRKIPRRRTTDSELVRTRQAEGKLVILDEAKAKSPKTAELAKALKAFDWGRALVIDGAELDDNFAKATRNIAGIDLLPSVGANVYDILRRDTLVLTKDAVAQLTERLK